MALPSVGGITRLLEITGPDDLVLATVAGADGAFPSKGGSGGLDGFACARFDNFDASTDGGSFYSGYIPLPSAQDLSSGLLVLHIKEGNNYGADSAEDSIRIALLSGASLTDYRVHGLGKRGDFLDFRAIGLADSPSQALAESTGFDISDVRAISILQRPQNTAQFGMELIVDQLLRIDQITYSGGDAGAPGTLDHLYAQMSNLTYTNTTHNLLMSKLGAFYQLGASLEVGTDLFADQNKALSFSPPSATQKIPSDFYRFDIKPVGDFTLSNVLISGENNLLIEPVAGNTSLSGCTVSGAGESNLNDCTITNSSFIGRTSLSISGGYYLGVSILDSGLVNLVSPATIERGIIDPPLASDVALQISIPAGNYSELLIFLDGGVNLAGGGGSYDFSGLTGATNFDAIDGGSYAVTLGADIAATKSDPTTNGSIDLITPQATIRFFGIPDVPNAILRVMNLTTGDVAHPVLTAGEATLAVDPSHDYQVRADAPGYLSSRFFTIPGSTPQFEFALAEYRALYDSGSNKASQIQLDLETFVTTITDAGDLTFAEVFHTLEDYLSTEQGIMLPYPPVPVVVDLGQGQRNYLFFPYDTDLDQVNPVRIKPDPSNTADPTLLDFVIVLVGADAPLFDIFDFSEAGGRSIRFQTDAVAAVLVSSGNSEFSATQSQQLADLHDTLEEPGVFAESALVATPNSQASEPSSARFDINLIARAEEGVDTPQSIQYREVVFCPDALADEGAVYIGRHNGVPRLITNEN